MKKRKPNRVCSGPDVLSIHHAPVGFGESACIPVQSTSEHQVRGQQKRYVFARIRTHDVVRGRRRRVVRRSTAPDSTGRKATCGEIPCTNSIFSNPEHFVSRPMSSLLLPVPAFDVRGGEMNENVQGQASTSFQPNLYSSSSIICSGLPESHMTRAWKKKISGGQMW